MRAMNNFALTDESTDWLIDAIQYTKIIFASELFATVWKQQQKEYIGYNTSNIRLEIRE